MFQTGKLVNPIPGYTGYIPKKENEQEYEVNKEVKPHIPGYQGYIRALKPENLHGDTYGKITYLSSAGMYHKGTDLPPELRFKSNTKDNYINQYEMSRSKMEITKEIQKTKNLQFSDILNTQTTHLLNETFVRHMSPEPRFKSHLNKTQSLGQTQQTHSNLKTVKPQDVPISFAEAKTLSKKQ